MWTYPEMALSTLIHRYLHARIRRQGPETIRSSLSLQTTSLPIYSRRYIIYDKSIVYRTSIRITTSSAKGKYHCPRNHRHTPLLCSSRRSHLTCRPWDTWLSADEANGKHFTRHQAPSTVCREPSRCHHTISFQRYGTACEQ